MVLGNSCQGVQYKCKTDSSVSKAPMEAVTVKYYFMDDYSYLSNFLNIDLDFATIQSILANNAFSSNKTGENAPLACTGAWM